MGCDYPILTRSKYNAKRAIARLIDIRIRPYDMSSKYLGLECFPTRSVKTAGGRQQAKTHSNSVPCALTHSLTRSLTATHRSLVPEGHPRVLLEQLLDLAQIRRHESLVGRYDVLVPANGFEDHLQARAGRWGKTEIKKTNDTRTQKRQYSHDLTTALLVTKKNKHTDYAIGRTNGRGFYLVCRQYRALSSRE